MSDTEDELILPPDTLAALQEFQTEEQQRLEQFRKLDEQAQKDYDDARAKDIELFKEDWQLSQFWYNAHTANTLALELLDGADKDTVICIISAPSVYSAITKLDPSEVPTKHIYLFEYDKRFRLLAGDEHYVFYDFNNPLEFPSHLRGKCHRALIDPPFLNDDCQTKSALTARSLLINQQERPKVKSESGTLQYRLMSCTGERMSTLISKVYPDTKITDFYPAHERGLSNEFRCYATYEGKRWKFIN